VTLSNLSFYDLHPTPASFRDEVLRGLASRPRSIPPKFFYDEQGSRLFQEICELPEYYLTRTEIGILRANAGEMAEIIGPGRLLIEFGSGSSEKVRLLLDALRPAAYMPLDISREHLWNASRMLAAECPDVAVHAVCTDYTQDMALPYDSFDNPAEDQIGLRKLAFFPGSSIGNFDPEGALAFMHRVSRLVQPDGGLLIGVDLKKDPRLLHAAYNDDRGVTAAFNLNLLARMNRELEADFDIAAFRHHAFYDESLGKIEMHLESLRDQTVTVAGEQFRFQQGEGMHTENSYKYRLEEFQALAARAGFSLVKVWTDPGRLFSVHYLGVRRRSAAA
jgi:dimethylhistidine N-methyltransferase